MAMEDRTSELPDFVIHIILSFLSTRDATRTSALSKTWLKAWESFPFLDFNHIIFSLAQQLLPQVTQKFLTYVDSSVERFVEKKLIMKRFKIVIDLVQSDPYEASPLLRKWMRLAADNMVEDLDLAFASHPDLYGNPAQRVFAVDPPKSNQFPTLRKLSLYGVHLDKQSVHCLIASCPYIEELNVIVCQGIEIFEISGLHYLETLEVNGFNFEKIDVDAPKLTNFIFADHSPLHRTRSEFPRQLFRISSSSLKDLTFWSLGITDHILHEIISNHPRIETLNLDYCNELERLKISIHWLKALKLHSCCMLKEVVIDAPNLRSFRYQGYLISYFALNSPVCVAQLDIFEAHHFSFFKWRKFLSNPVRLKKLILIMEVAIEPMQDGFDGEGLLGDTSVPGQWILEDLEMQLESPYSSYIALSNNILWSCMPKTMRVLRSRKKGISFMKHIYRKLMRRDTYKCSLYHCVTCWRHYLKGAVEIINQDDNICFKLEWDRCEVSLLSLDM